MLRSGAKPSWETAPPSRTIAMRNGNDWRSLSSIVRDHTLRSPAFDEEDASGVTLVPRLARAHWRIRVRTCSTNLRARACDMAPTVWVRPSWEALGVSGNRKVRVSALLMPLPVKVVRSQRVAA
jgi:hypothetical protein